MSKDIFDDFAWHSSIGIDETLEKNRRFVTRLAASNRNLHQFLTAGDSLLIHKTTKALWKFSDDHKSIEPVFGSDILTEDDLKSLADEDDNG